ncbi:KTSC domain-containing protein [Alistipes putredinis]|uniref:KTSC domain-containing protein n=1 Tax=Alistipes putredinis TaxID=28117 RepID=UPI003AB676C8
MQIVSSNIRTADYDRRNRVLRMTFVNRPNWLYEYFNVPVKIWTRFLQADSKGQYFSAYIRDAYRYRRSFTRK